jgi:hypothetical protein
MDVVRAVRRADQASSAGQGEVPDQGLSEGRSAHAFKPNPRPDLNRGIPASSEERTPLEATVAPTRDSAAGTPSGAPWDAVMHQEESAAFVPADLWREAVPDPRERRGDPVETERRLCAELEPARLLDTIRRMIVMRRFSRNNLYTDVYIRPDFVWLVLPRALRRLALINHLPFDSEVLKRMLASLGSSPLVEPAGPGGVLVYMKPRIDSSTFEAVRIRTSVFLTTADQDRLGFHTTDISVLDGQASTGTSRR